MHRSDRARRMSRMLLCKRNVYCLLRYSRLQVDLILTFGSCQSFSSTHAKDLKTGLLFSLQPIHNPSDHSILLNESATSDSRSHSTIHSSDIFFSSTVQLLQFTSRRRRLTRTPREIICQRGTSHTSLPKWLSQHHQAQHRKTYQP